MLSSNNANNRMLIITSDENLIEEVSVRQSYSTQMIELNGNQTNNSIDLQFLAQLSQYNNANDQIYKRALNSPQSNRLKMLKNNRKNLNVNCMICGDHAIGFNYDVLTCASCKAFFRRNAQYNPEKVRCLSGENNCSVNVNIIRKCQRCRLVKCFSMGMRKDFILSEEEKQRRKQRIEFNRQLSIDYQSNQENNQQKQLSIEDWLTIENIHSSYLIIFENRPKSNTLFESSDHLSALNNWSQFASERSIKLIEFLRQIDLFENLNADDKFILIKYNLLFLYFIQKSLNYNPLTRTFGNRQLITNEDILKRRQFWQLVYGASGIPEYFKELIHSFTIATENDSKLINLILVMLIFSKGLSMNEHEPILKDNLNVFKNQCFYVELIWNYLISKNGQFKAVKQFIEILQQIHRIQSYSIHFRNYMQTSLLTQRPLQHFAPLMQSVLDIS